MDKDFNIFINKSSGSTRLFGENSLKKLVHESGLNIKNLFILPPDELFPALKKCVQKYPDTPLLIGGGDGTIKSALEICAEFNNPVGILPLGTMNCLARDMEIPIALPDALQSYAKQELFIHHIDAASVNKEMFFCSACLGAIPESTLYREENRGVSMPLLFPKLTLNMVEGMEKMARRKIHLDLDNKQKRSLCVSTIVISNNLYDHQEDWGIDGLKRSSLDSEILGVYAAQTKTTFEKIKLLLRLRIGGWQKEPVIKKWTGKKLTINTSQGEELLTLDGELIRLKPPLEFSIHPNAVRILSPQPKKVEAL